jgi:hypothetical protein
MLTIISFNLMCNLIKLTSNKTRNLSKEDKKMNLLFDLVTSDGEEIKECYFVHYFRNIRGGVNNTILAHASDSLRCFNKQDEEIKDIKLLDTKITKIVDVNTGLDITEHPSLFLSMNVMCREERYID